MAPALSVVVTWSLTNAPIGNPLVGLFCWQMKPNHGKVGWVVEKERVESGRHRWAYTRALSNVSQIIQFRRWKRQQWSTDFWIPWSRVTPTWTDSLLLWVVNKWLLGSSHGRIVVAGSEMSCVGSERFQAVAQSEVLPSGTCVSLVKTSWIWTLWTVAGGSSGPKKICNGPQVLANSDTCWSYRIPVTCHLAEYW